MQAMDGIGQGTNQIFLAMPVAKTPLLTAQQMLSRSRFGDVILMARIMGMK